MRVLALVLVAFAFSCTTPRLTSGCKSTVSDAVSPIYAANDALKKDALEPGQVRKARVLLEETRRQLYLHRCDDRDRAAALYSEVQVQFERAEEMVEKLETARGVRWDGVVAIRDLEPTFEREWRWLEDGRTLSTEEMENL